MKQNIRRPSWPGTISTAISAVFLWAFLVPVGASLLLASWGPSHAQVAAGPAQIAPCVETGRLKNSVSDVFWDATPIDLEGSEASVYVAGFNARVRLEDGELANVQADRVLIVVERGLAIVLFSFNGQVCDERYYLGEAGNASLLARALGRPI